MRAEAQRFCFLQTGTTRTQLRVADIGAAEGHGAHHRVTKAHGRRREFVRDARIDRRVVAGVFSEIDAKHTQILEREALLRRDRPSTSGLVDFLISRVRVCRGNAAGVPVVLPNPHNLEGKQSGAFVAPIVAQLEICTVRPAHRVHHVDVARVATTGTPPRERLHSWMHRIVRPVGQRGEATAFVRAQLVCVRFGISVDSRAVDERRHRRELLALRVRALATDEARTLEGYLALNTSLARVRDWKRFDWACLATRVRDLVRDMLPEKHDEIAERVIASVAHTRS